MIFQLETFPLLVWLCFVTEIHQTHFQCITTLTFFTIKTIFNNTFNAGTNQEILFCTISTYTNCILYH